MDTEKNLIRKSPKNKSFDGLQLAEAYYGGLRAQTSRSKPLSAEDAESLLAVLRDLAHLHRVDRTDWETSAAVATAVDVGDLLFTQAGAVLRGLVIAIERGAPALEA